MAIVVAFLDEVGRKDLAPPCNCRARFAATTMKRLMLCSGSPGIEQWALFFGLVSDIGAGPFTGKEEDRPTLIKRRGSWIEVTQLWQVGNGKATHVLFHSPFESRTSARAAARRRDPYAARVRIRLHHSLAWTIITTSRTACLRARFRIIC